MMSQIETQSFKVIKNFKEVELRFYPPVMMAEYISSKPGSGFRKLFEYISGNNNSNTKISMTTPVHIKKGTKENSMAFVLPAKFNQKNSPIPNDNSLQLYEEKSGFFAAIKYSGYTDESKEEEFTDKLKNILTEFSIDFSGPPTILVYNSPYKFFNRRNEILISVNYKK